MTEQVSSARLVQFIGALSALVASVLGVAWWVDTDPLVLGPAYMLTPLIAGAIVCLTHGIGWRAVGLRIGRPRWLLYSALIWFPIGLAILGVAVLFPGVSFDPTMIASELGVPNAPLWLGLGFVGLLVMMVIFGSTVNAVLGFGEEFGWRGYLLWELAPLGFWKASFAIGLLWGLWHAPLVYIGLNYPSYPLIGIIVFTVVCMAISPLFTFVVLKGRSVLPAALLHGVFNAGGFLGLVATDEAMFRELVASEGGIAGLAVYLVVLGLLVRVGTPGISRQSFDETALGPGIGVPTASD